MKLSDWLESHEYSNAAFARLLTAKVGRKITPSSVFQYRRGTMPLWDVGHAIEWITGGEVTPVGLVAQDSNAKPASFL